MERNNRRSGSAVYFGILPIPKATGLVLTMVGVVVALVGCASGKATKQNTSFFTSGSKDADQRASQRMAKAEQLSGESEKSSGTGVKKSTSTSGGAAPGAAQATEKTALYTRLGGQPGISNIVSDVLPRLLQDPRVNWARTGIKRGGFFHRGSSSTWENSPQNIAVLKQHLVEFLALASGGPAHYTGKDMKPVHAGMQISNPEFDAVVGDVKASLDRLKVPNTDQKELLAIIESTRPQIVEQR